MRSVVSHCLIAVAAACGGTPPSDKPGATTSAAGSSSVPATTTSAGVGSAEAPLPAGARARLGGSAFRVSERIGTVAASDDGALVATNDAPGVRVWDARTGATVRRWAEDYEHTKLAVFAGRRLVFAHGNTEVVSLDVASGAVVKIAACAEREGLAGLALAPDARSVAVLCSGTVVQLALDRGARPARTVLATLDPSASRLAWSPDGARIAVGGEIVVLIDVAKRTVKEGPGSNPDAGLAFSPVAPGRLAYVGGSDRGCAVSVYDVETHVSTPLASCGAYRDPALAWSRDGKRLAVAAERDEKSLDVIDTTTGAVRSRVDSGFMSAFAFADAAGTRAWIGDDRAVRLWDLDTDREVAGAAGPSSGISALAYSPDGQLLAAGETGDELRVWPLAARDPLAASTHVYASAPIALAWRSADELFVASKDGIQTHARAEKTATDRLGAPDYYARATVFAGPFAASTGWEVTNGDSHDAVHVVRPGSVTPVQTFRVEGLRHGIALSRDGKLVAFEQSSTSVEVHDSATGAPRAAVADAGPALAFSLDGAHLAVCGGGCRVYDLASQQIVATVPLEADVTAQVAAFTPDGHLVVGTEHGDVIVATFGGDAPVVTVHRRVHGSEVTALALAPDGRSFATGGADGQILLWPL